MDLLDKKFKTVSNKPELSGNQTCASDVGGAHIDHLRPANQQKSIESAVCLITNVVETACEHFSDQGLLRFANYLDLYAVYLEMAKNPDAGLRSTLDSLSAANSAVVTQELSHTGLVSFERFVRDSRLIALAAKSISNERGEPFSPPPPITLSAND